MNIDLNDLDLLFAESPKARQEFVEALLKSLKEALQFIDTLRVEDEKQAKELLDASLLLSSRIHRSKKPSPKKREQLNKINKDLANINETASWSAAEWRYLITILWGMTHTDGETFNDTLIASVVDSYRKNRPAWAPGGAGGAGMRTRGRPAGTRERTAAGMREDIETGKITEEQFRSMPPKVLAARYRVHRDTALAARLAVLRELETIAQRAAKKGSGNSVVDFPASRLAGKTST